jgi:hypothetical protein
LETIFLEDLDHCDEVSLEAVRQRSRRERLKEQGVRLLAPLLLGFSDQYWDFWRRLHVGREAALYQVCSRFAVWEGDYINRFADPSKRPMKTGGVEKRQFMFESSSFCYRIFKLL